MSDLGPRRVELAPGQELDLEIPVTNRREFLDGVRADVQGVDDDWVQRPVGVLNLLPRDTGVLPVRLVVPPDGPARRYPVRVSARSVVDDITTADQPLLLDLDVAPVEKGTLKLVPSLVNGGSRTAVRATVRNEGNCTLDCTVTAEDETKALDVRVEPPAVSILQGRDGTARVHVSGPRPWFGNTVTRTVTVIARGDQVELRSLLTFNQKPRVPRGVLTAVLLAAIVGVWVAALVFGSDLLAPEAKAKVLPRGLAAPETVSRDAVSATLEGTMRSPFGDPLSRITVEAYRYPGGSTVAAAARAGSARTAVPAQAPTAVVPSFVGSAATDGDGKFVLRGLPPGTYAFRMSGRGFPPTWFPADPARPDAASGVPEPAGAVPDGGAPVPPPGVAPKRLGPQERSPLLDEPIAVAGQPGSIAARIRDPEGLIPLGITVAVYRIPGASEETTEPELVQEPIQLAIDGQLLVTGLATPSSYVLDVTSATGEYEPAVIRVGLAAGDRRDLGEVRLDAGDGSIAGRVVDEAGRPLGDVAVRAESGDVVRTARTPTAGPNQGEFLLTDLPTPRTYVLSFTKDGFGPRSLTVPLAPGADRNFAAEGVTISLAGGLGTVSGTVLDVAGAPLGGVQVEVTRGDFAGTTTSLTTGEPGAFRMSGLATPGTYVLSFTGDGLLPETLAVTFDDTGRSAPVVVRMRPATAVVRGAVLGSQGEPLTDVTVELSDGVRPRLTLTSADPAGGYAFDAVAPGPYTLSFTKDGFRPFRTVIFVLPATTVNRDARLAKV